MLMQPLYGRLLLNASRVPMRLPVHSPPKSLTVLDMELMSPSEPIGRLSYEFAHELAKRGHKVIVLQILSATATPRLRKGL